MIKRSGDVNRVKTVAILSALVTATILTTCSARNLYKDYQEELRNKEIEESFRIIKNMKKVEEKMIREKEFEEKVQDRIEQNKRLRKERELKEEKERQALQEIKNKTGLPVVGFKEYIFELSFYSDLNCENGFGNLTANGEKLSQGMIANNFLPFDTMVYLEGYGTKRVTDRGSYKYFNSVNKADVFVPRMYGESDSEYYKRVNNMGRIQVKGYVLEMGGEN